jgi:hypothetical protein
MVAAPAAMKNAINSVGIHARNMVSPTRPLIAA